MDKLNSYNWKRAIDRMFEEKHKADEEFDKTLKTHEPIATYEDCDYWYSELGVMRVRKLPNGKYERHSVRFFADAEVRAMIKAYFSREKVEVGVDLK